MSAPLHSPARGWDLHHPGDLAVLASALEEADRLAREHGTSVQRVFDEWHRHGRDLGWLAREFAESREARIEDLFGRMPA